MAIKIGTIPPTPELTLLESIGFVHLNTSATLSPDDWTITYQFENASYDPDGKLIGSPNPTEAVIRRVIDIKDDPDVQLVMKIIKEKGYIYRQENIDNAAKAEAERIAAEKQAEAERIERERIAAEEQAERERIFAAQREAAGITE